MNKYQVSHPDLPLGPEGELQLIGLSHSFGAQEAKETSTITFYNVMAEKLGCYPLL